MFYLLLKFSKNHVQHFKELEGGNSIQFGLKGFRVSIYKHCSSFISTSQLLRVTHIICAEAWKEEMKALANCHFYDRFMGCIESGKTLNKLDVPNLVTSLNQTPRTIWTSICLVEWHVVRCGNGYQKDTSLEEIGLHYEKMTTILGSIVNILYQFEWAWVSFLWWWVTYTVEIQKLWRNHLWLDLDLLNISNYSRASLIHLEVGYLEKVTFYIGYFRAVGMMQDDGLLSTNEAL